MAKKGHKRESTSGEIEEYLANLATVLCDNCVPLPGQSDNCVVHTGAVDKFLLSPAFLPLLVDVPRNRLIGPISNQFLFTAQGRAEMEKVKVCKQSMCKFFLGWVKSVPNFKCFCCKSELRCNFAFFGVILMDFNLVFFSFTLKRRTNLNNNSSLASLYVWQS